MKHTLKVTLLAALLLAGPALAQTALPSPDSATIAAVVNGQVITNQDVLARAKLLALSSGMPADPDSLERLAPQVTSQLIDQTLELQEINRRNVTVAPDDIEAAISHIEQGNGLPAGGLQARLTQAGIPFSTLVNQIRIELGWQTVLHQVLGPGLQPTYGDLQAEKTALRAELGSTQYHVAEIFVPVPDPANDSAARDFANTVITQLRAGAPFPIVAAQFSQSPTALQGGDLGFVELSQLDPAVAAIVGQMPVGAISNPVRVPGGYEIVQLLETHKVGTDLQTILTLAQAFGAFPTPISGAGPTPAQDAVISKLAAMSAAAHSCADITADNAQLGNIRPADPGPVNLATVTPPAFQQILAGLVPGKASRPLVERDGASIVMLCAKSQQAQGLPSDQDIGNIIVENRVELESKQLLEDLRHRSIITQNN